jgi:hypothetical protein
MEVQSNLASWRVSANVAIFIYSLASGSLLVLFPTFLLAICLRLIENLILN